MGTETFTARDLRRRWKPKKEQLNIASPDHPTCVRLHRAFSWLARSEQQPDADPDVALITLWIGFNSLYGQWDSDRREPVADGQSWRQFIGQLFHLDASGHLSAMLHEHREGVMAILDDEYVSKFFWEEPTPSRAGKARKVRFDARTWYIDRKWPLILERLIERIYMLRCQLVHGAATHGGQLNRHSLQRCVAMLQLVLSASLLVIIDHGEEADWGVMCYPPLW